jgi:hypothetical protein
VVNGQYGLRIQVAHGCNVRRAQVGDRERRTCPAAPSRPVPALRVYLLRDT